MKRLMIFAIFACVCGCKTVEVTPSGFKKFCNMDREKRYEIIRIRADAVALELEGSENLARIPTKRLFEIYNGVGPCYFSDQLRKGLSKTVKPLLPAIMVHDYDFELSDGSVSGFHAANRRLLTNCIVCANNAYTWTDIRRYVLYFKAFLMYRTCKRFGWSTWLKYKTSKKR